jgi:hypothetical protein
MSAQVAITQLPAAGAITGTEAVPIVQNGVTVQTTTGAISASPSQTQSFLTVYQEPTLPNSRYVGATNGLTISDAGAQGLFNISTTGALLSLVSSGTGFQVKTSATAIAARSIAVSGAGLSISNGDGILDNPTVSLTGQVLNLANYSGNGLLTITTGGTISSTSVQGTTNQISVTNGNGVSGYPTIGIASNPILPGLAGVGLPAGSTADRGVSAVNGTLRYNSDYGILEAYLNSVWTTLASGSGVTSIATGTGLTGGPITSTGTISLANTTVTAGSYTAANITVNAQGQITAASSNSSLVSSFSAGSTGLTPATATTGAITLAGTLVPANGGTGATSLTGYVYGNGTSTMTASTTIPTTALSGTVTNAQLANSSITLGTTNIALGGTSLAPVGLTSVTVTQNPTTGLQLATKAYVDNQLAAGIDIHTACVDDSDANLSATYANGGTTPTWTTITTNNTLATASAHGLAVNDVIVFGSTTNGITAGTAYFVESVPTSTTITLSLTYEGAQITSLTNGTGLTITSRANAGVGATLTSTANGPLVLESYTAALNDRILILGQSSAFQNGCYYVSQVGVASVSPWILTRATDANKYIPNSALGLDQGSYFLITGGSDSGEAYVCNTTGTIVFGTTNITFGQFSQVQNYTAGTGLSLSGSNVFSISNTAVTAAAYGSASSVATFTVNAQGQLTLAASTSIAIAASQVTSGALAVAQGGTNLASYATGDMLYATGATTLSKLTIGTANYVMTSTGTAPQYVAQSTLSVGSAANIGITANSTNATNYLTFVSTTTGNLPQLVNSSITCNPSTGALTGGISGGTF